MAARPWTAGDERTLRRLYPKLPLAELARRLGRTEKAIRSRAKLLGVTTGRRNRWTPAEDAVLRERYATTFTQALAEEIGRQYSSVSQRAALLGLRKDPQWVREHCRCLDPETGKAHRFEPGQESWNKGRKGWTAGGRSAETRFRKGARPQTWVPVGTEVIDREGYAKRKVRDDAPKGMSRFNWKFVHVLVWEEANGPVPKGYCVRFRDGNKRHVSLDNLELVSRQDHMRRNTVHRLPKPLKQLLRAKASLTRAINDREGRRGRRDHQRSA